MIVLHVSTGLSTGGAERTLRNLVVNDLSNAHVVVSLTTLGSQGFLLQKNGTKVIALDLPKSFRGFFTGIKSLRHIIRDLRPDVVQTWMYHSDLIGGLAALLAGTRQIAWNIRASAPREASGGISASLLRGVVAILSWIIPRTIITCSSTAIEEHVAIGYRKSIFRFIPNGFDSNLWIQRPDDKPTLRSKIGASPGDLLVGLVARFDPQKNHSQFLTSANQLIQEGFKIHVVLVGSGAALTNQNFLELVRKTKFPLNRLSALGEQEEIPRIMGALDLLTLPSSYGEGFPNVLAESMLCETPCIASDSGDSASIIGDTGWVYDRNAPGLLTENLAAALRESQDIREKRGLESRKRILKSFPLKQMVDQYSEHFSSLSLACEPAKPAK